MPMDFTVSDPPKRIVDNDEFEEVIAGLIQHEGEYVCVFTQGTETETASRNVRPRLIDYAARRGINLEAETHKAKGKVKVWARYLNHIDPTTEKSEG